MLDAQLETEVVAPDRRGASPLDEMQRPHIADVLKRRRSFSWGRAAARYSTHADRSAVTHWRREGVVRRAKRLLDPAGYASAFWVRDATQFRNRASRYPIGLQPGVQSYALCASRPSLAAARPARTPVRVVARW
jgi:hypothetical protein